MKLSYKYPFIVFSPSSDCFVCAFKILSEATFLFKSECSHINKELLQPRVYMTKFRLFVIFLFMLPLNAVWFTRFGILNYHASEEESFIRNMFDFLTESWTLLLVLSVFKNRTYFTKCFNGIIEIIDNRKKFKISSIFLVEDTERFQYGTLFILILLYTVVWLEMISNYNVFEYSNIIKSLTKSVSLLSGCFGTLHIILWLDAYEKIFSKVLELIKNEFDSRKIDKPVPDNGFAEKLRLYQMYYLFCAHSYRHHIFAYVTLFLYAWHFIYIIISYVFSFLYISFIVVRQDVELEKSASDRLLQSLYVVGISFFIMRRATEIYHMGDNLITYIYKYPTTRLTTEERYLVEILIQNLTFYKPVLTPGDIFEIQKKNIPSVISHVITYSLVAIQFNVIFYFY